MTERSFAQNNRFWMGVVVNVMDPDQEGRVQVRIHGLHDDETNIPNSALPWSKPSQPITSAAHNKIGTSAVGAVVGTSVFGMFLDEDQQYPIHIGTVAKAGDASSSGTSSSGAETLETGTNSTPPGSRILNNAFITRASQNIKNDDQTQITYQNNYTPTEQKDSDGVDITAKAIAKTKYASNPSVASLTTLAGSVLQQLQQVDPQNLNAVLQQAIPAFIQMKDLNTFSSAEGSLGVMGQTLGNAFQQIASQIGQSALINNIASAIENGGMSSNLSTVLEQALLNLNTPIIASDTVQGVINLSLQSLIDTLLPLLNNGSLTLYQFENIISIFLQEIQNNGSQAVLGEGATQSNIFNMLTTLLPTIAQNIQTTLNTHLPPSFLDQGLVSQALQKFSMNQAFVKAPTNGRKALAIKATSQVVPPNSGTSVGDVISGIQGVTQQAQSTLSNAFNYVVQAGQS